MVSEQEKLRRREQSRRWSGANRDRRNAIFFKSRHAGWTLADKAALLEEQSGCCYLCGDELALDDAIIEHDHRCCQRPNTCAACRRGLACRPCNILVGMALDDPDRLRRIADSLDAAKALVDDRIAVDFARSMEEIS